MDASVWHTCAMLGGIVVLLEGREIDGAKPRRMCLFHSSYSILAVQFLPCRQHQHCSRSASMLPRHVRRSYTTFAAMLRNTYNSSALPSQTTKVWLQFQEHRNKVATF